MADYSTIDNPYNSNLERTSTFNSGSLNTSVVPSVNNAGNNFNNYGNVVSPSQLNKNVVSNNTLSNIWIKNWIKSESYKPKKNGFLFDGVKGYIEARDLYVSNGIFKGTFEIGGVSKTVSTVESLQPAIDEIREAGGGIIYLKAGTYLLTADISLPSGVTLQGVSRDDVIIDCNTLYKVKIIGTNAYNTGTVSINNGDTVAVGSGTSWTSDMVGRFIMLADLYFEITAVTDSTHLDIAFAYSGDNLLNSTYVLADVVFNARIKDVTIQNGIGFKAQYVQEYFLDNLMILNCTTGIDDDDTVYSQIVASCDSCNVGLDFNNSWGWKIDWFAATNNINEGVKMVNSGSGTFFDSAVADNGGNGISLTNVENFALISVNIFSNNNNGIEFISGCNDVQFMSVVADGNTNDGIKITATSDRNSISACSMINNGGFGINVAAATCNKNFLIGNFATINDAGTGTVNVGNTF